MSAYECCKVVSLPAAGNLDGKQYEALTINASGQVAVSTATTDFIVGLLATNPGTTVAGDAVPVALIAGGGIGLFKAGAAITNGHVLVLDATDGRVSGVAALSGIATDSMAVGIAIESAADGEVFRGIMMPLFESQ